MKETLIPSCTKALFDGNNDLIKHLCVKEYIVKKTHSAGFIDLSLGHLLVASHILQQKLILKCHCQAPISIEPCVHCTLAVPCYCQVKASEYYIASTLNAFPQ